jgi:hypothetical protein
VSRAGLKEMGLDDNVGGWLATTQVRSNEFCESFHTTTPKYMIPRGFTQRMRFDAMTRGVVGFP